MNNSMRIGFYVRNGFQVSHFRPLFDTTPGAVWIAKSAKKLRSIGVADTELSATSTFFLRRLMNSCFDVVVSQASPPGGRRLEKSKFVMTQYGYAKEPYNFGKWRASADLILAYGPYAQERFSKRAPSIAIGNPRWDDWNSPAFQSSAKAKLSKFLRTDRPTVLYAPTWGELSSVPDWLEDVVTLSKDHQVLIKAHHNSVRDGQLISQAGMDNIHFVPDEDLFSLMLVSDVVISDLSGAIFDSVLCKIPVVLVAPSELYSKMGKKLDNDSLEVAHRADFGLIVNSGSELKEAIAAAIDNGPIASAEWYEHLFVTDGTVAERFSRALATIAD